MNQIRVVLIIDLDCGQDPEEEVGSLLDHDFYTLDCRSDFSHTAWDVEVITAEPIYN
jgi:hypothetical protein